MLIVASCVVSHASSGDVVAQMPLGVFPAPVYPSPAYSVPAYAVPTYGVSTTVVSVKTRHHRPCLHCHKQAPVSATYTAYYAPQVPVVPMAAVPVPTVSAYYVPTVPVFQPYYAAVVPVAPVRRYSAAFAPTAIYPVYWMPY